MVVLKYNKTYDELTRDEIIAAVRVYDDDQYNKTTQKTVALLKLTDISTQNNYDWDSETLFYFDGDNATKTVVCCKPSEIVVTEYSNTRPRYWADFDKIVAENNRVIEIESNEENSTVSNQEILNMLVAQDKTINSLCNVNENTMSRKFSQLNKIKVEFDDNVPHFIALVDEWASSNQIYDDDQIIRKASAAITQSAQGMSIREALAISPSNTWGDFKQKLQELLGQDKSFYRKQFRTLQKQEFETFGQYLAKLTMNFKYAYKLQIVSKHDRTQIKTQFIDNLEQPLKGFLEAEDLKEEIPFTNLAARAEQLFRAHGMNDLTNKEHNVCHIRSQRKTPEINIPDILAESRKQNQEFFSNMMNSQQTFMRNFMNQMRLENIRPVNAIQHSRSNLPAREYSHKRPPMTEARRAELKQMPCFNFKNTGKCNFAERCFYNHSKN